MPANAKNRMSRERGTQTASEVCQWRGARLKSVRAISEPYWQARRWRRWLPEGHPNRERNDFGQDERASRARQPAQRTGSVEVLGLPGRALIVDGGRQIVDIGGVRVPVGVNVPKRKNELRRKRNQCDPGEPAMPPERHDGPPSKSYSITLCRSATSGSGVAADLQCRHAFEKEPSAND
jgi:hypothetical protein